MPVIEIKFEPRDLAEGRKGGAEGAGRGRGGGRGWDRGGGGRGRGRGRRGGGEWEGGQQNFVRFVLYKENMDTQVVAWRFVTCGVM